MLHDFTLQNILHINLQDERDEEMLKPVPAPARQPYKKLSQL